MKNFAIIRVEKLKTFGAISASAQHCFRERPTPNADTSKQNLVVGATTSEGAISMIRERMASVDRTDKQAIPCLEYVVAASTEQPVNYFVDSLNWLKQRHGEENVVSATIHNDETTRHMTVYVVPVVQVAETTRKRSVNKKGGGREVKTEVVPAHTLLSAKHFTGGREVLSQLQSDFADQVGAKHGLDRGVKRDKTGPQVKHQSVKAWYQKKDALMAEFERHMADLAVSGQKSADFEAEIINLTKRLESQFADGLNELAKVHDDLAKQKDQLAQDRGKLQAESQRLSNLQTALTGQETALQGQKKKMDTLQATLNEKAAQIASGESKLSQDQDALDHRRRVLELFKEGLDRDRKTLDATIESKVKELTADVRANAVKQKKLFIDAYNALPVEVKKEACKTEVVVAALKTISPKKSQGVSM